MLPFSHSGLPFPHCRPSFPSAGDAVASLAFLQLVESASFIVENHKHMKAHQPFLQFVNGCLAILVLLLGSCSKQDGSRAPGPNYEEQRIATITIKDEVRTARFTYDDQKRLSRIDYNDEGNPSLRFTYNGQTITARYYKGAAPDPQREKYVFTLLNNLVVNTRMTQPDGDYYDTYFEYDAQNRIVEIGFRSVSSGGSVGATLDCYYSYPAQSNTQDLKMYGQYLQKETDTITQTRTWHSDKQFVSLSNLGFDYFGKSPAGIAYNLIILQVFCLQLSRSLLSEIPGI
jgi:hypothetical protein